ncbi:GNAT family N-acetyltransferase [Octadecabacter sp. G9-8]|uniref:GNAT family N-acetyltransferase n=1 Tax=Octadecabacter dasysiphoniae TaxID=2909341 RepID=A0ABS9CWK5_9RHOB|nr:GNAT family N-acetyltransferase [Octadecabacter dasysiphoniae]MCF2871656.1 GNAT family N-acetyltransferase [Octadecabacter dasysiphoniae]
MTLRALDSINDRHIVASFFAAAADYVTLETGAPPKAATTQDFFDDRPPNVAPDDVQRLGLFEHEHLVGLLAFSFGYPEPTDCYIGLLLLSPGLRGQGNGPRALAHATSLARARGMRRQLVAVLDANPKARAFWEREGFVWEQTFAPSDDAHSRHRLIREI